MLSICQVFQFALSNAPSPPQSKPPDAIPLDDRLWINILDTPYAQIRPHFWKAVQFIHAARASGKPVYVHCAAGLSLNKKIN